MRDVAERAGVSSMTVSFVVNGKRVTEQNRIAVLAAIKELGYVPNTSARALASVQSTRIGMLYQEVDGHSHGFLTDLLVGAVRATVDGGVQLVIQGCPTTLEGTFEALQALARRDVAAILLPAQYAYFADQLKDRFSPALPMVALAPGTEDYDMPSVGIDDFTAAREMTALLIAKGHRRIGFLRGLTFHPASQTRYKGYLAALGEAGLEEDPGLVRQGNFIFKEALPAASELLDLADPPTAIFAANDDMAAAVLSAAHRRGLAVPDDLAVAGFDDAPLATQIWPTLTTVRQPLALIAEEGVRVLLQALQAGPTTTLAGTRYLDHEIIERETT